MNNNKTVRTSVKELAKPAVFLQRGDQCGCADAEEQRRLERRTEAHDLQDVRMLVELLANRPLVVVGKVRLLAALLGHLSSQNKHVETYLLCRQSQACFESQCHKRGQNISALFRGHGRMFISTAPHSLASATKLTHTIYRSDSTHNSQVVHMYRSI